MQDINRSVLAIATLLTLMKGTTIGAIRCGDTNLNPLDISKKYDIVVIDPPYNAKRYEPTYIESAFSTFNLPEIGVYESSYLPVRHAVASLNDEGMALVICPMGMLFSSGKTAAVREIVINNYLDTVIELPNGMCDNTVIPLVIRSWFTIEAKKVMFSRKRHAQPLQTARCFPSAKYCWKAARW